MPAVADAGTSGDHAHPGRVMAVAVLEVAVGVTGKTVCCFAGVGDGDGDSPSAAAEAQLDEVSVRR